MRNTLNYLIKCFDQVAFNMVRMQFVTGDNHCQLQRYVVVHIISYRTDYSENLIKFTLFCNGILCFRREENYRNKF